MFPKPNHKRRKPKRGQRGRITKTDYKDALDWFGDSCTICNNKPIEMHHVIFRSAGGRNGYRNLMPLCKSCHAKAHADRQFADHLREMRQEAYGDHFFHDMHDLYDMGLIDEPTEQKFEAFMQKEERK
ncbi:HNH endonuclease [Sporosarcina highlanderae]|uniref:HNH endonuclease signature motif containing protein n=1 Tax=Sporosarcina highlanderae TaxID=3035916 RepID=A0ABT8JX57_9BACL|nr:HNH endonuclease signature motif containing protein [Sporosarcina highlanderae]MDN4609151.1 HNH endonuclease signature motif containing protein [Sporosarcina highlanderae]